MTNFFSVASTNGRQTTQYPKCIHFFFHPSLTFGSLRVCVTLTSAVSSSLPLQRQKKEADANADAADLRTFLEASDNINDVRTVTEEDRCRMQRWREKLNNTVLILNYNRPLFRYSVQFWRAVYGRVFGCVEVVSARKGDEALRVTQVRLLMWLLFSGL